MVSPLGTKCIRDILKRNRQLRYGTGLTQVDEGALQSLHIDPSPKEIIKLLEEGFKCVGGENEKGVGVDEGEIPFTRRANEKTARKEDLILCIVLYINIDTEALRWA